jgi:hypothetical protein
MKASKSKKRDLGFWVFLSFDIRASLIFELAFFYRGRRLVGYSGFVHLLALVEVPHRVHRRFKAYMEFAKINCILSLLVLKVPVPVFLVISAEHVDETDFVGWAFFNKKYQLVVLYPPRVIKT